MKVTREDRDGPLDRLVVTAPGESDHDAGDCIGYLCPQCRAVDETARRLYHERDCEHAGAHGRRFYEKSEFVDMSSPTPEFRDDTTFWTIKFAETEGRGGLCEGEVLGWECTCGMADENIFGIMHAETCPLAHVDPTAGGVSAAASD